MLIPIPKHMDEPEPVVQEGSRDTSKDDYVRWRLDCPNWVCAVCRATNFGRNKYCAYCKLTNRVTTLRPASYVENVYAGK